MPRINIEDKWWSDPRRGALIAKLGSVHLADGVMVGLWRISQEFNGQPFEWASYYDKDTVDAISSTGLASVEHQLIYVKGSRDHHEWLKAKRDAARKGGKKSAELRQAPLEQTSTKRKQIQPSSSYSISNTSNIYIKGSDFWSLFKTLFKQKKGREPSPTKIAMAKASELEKVLPKEEWQDVITSFLDDENPFYYKQGFQIHWLLNNLDKHRRLAAQKDKLIEFFESTLSEVQSV